jgi:hypothetical protein
MMDNILQIVGSAFVVAGAALIWVPLGFIVAGIIVIVIGISLESK